VGRIDQVARPGQYFSGEVVGEPYLVVRGKDDVLRAFFNVCRHHAAQVAQGSGCAHRFTCPYHGWTYGDDGALIKAPRLGPAKDFQPSSFGLVEIPVACWGPLVAIQVEAHDGASELAPPPTLHPELHGTFDASQWGRLTFVARRSWDLECNWKVFVDNYLDGGYHVSVLHGDLASRLELADYKTQLYDASVLQSCQGRDDERVGERALYGWIYPNFMLNRYGSWLDTNLVLPLGPSRCRVVFDYFCEPALAQDAAFVEASLKASEKVQEEDITISESVQRGLMSRGYDRGRYAPRLEMGEHLFHRLLHDDVARGLGMGTI
jgi:choline monooxygenase